MAESDTMSKVSKRNDAEFIQQINSNHQAASLRAESGIDADNAFYDTVEFSWRQFWESLMYENFPPGLMSPLVALVIERSFSRAWYVCQNRGIFPLSTKYNSLGFIIICWLFFFPGSWLLTTALILSLFTDTGSMSEIDTFLVIVAYVCLFMRRLIISVKYGYFRKETYEKLSMPAPEWDGDKTRRQLVTWGWSKPRDYPGLIEDELAIAMDENDVLLQGIPFSLDQKSAEFFEKKGKGSRYSPKTKLNNESEISAAFLVTEILKSAYENNPGLKKIESVMNIITATFALSLPALALLISNSYAVDFFGSSLGTVVVGIGTLIGLFLCHQLLLFGLLCRFDFGRRRSCIEMLGDLIEYPGINLRRLYPDDPEINKQDRFVLIDLEQRSNVFAWTLTRRVLKSFGSAFYDRIQGYTSILFLFSLICVAMLNVIFWAPFGHHVSTVSILIVIISVIAFASLGAIFSAISLQRLSEIHRDRLRKKIFILEEKIANFKVNKNTDGEESLTLVRALLQQADESISFNELSYKPTVLLGYPASRSLIGSFLGILFTGLVIGLEGFSASGIFYDISGWFIAP